MQLRSRPHSRRFEYDASVEKKEVRNEWGTIKLNRDVNAHERAPLTATTARPHSFENGATQFRLVRRRREQALFNGGLRGRFFLMLGRVARESGRLMTKLGGDGTRVVDAEGSHNQDERLGFRIDFLPVTGH
jgi:hypothetical protein